MCYYVNMEDKHLSAVVKGINRRRYRDLVLTLDDPNSGYNNLMAELRNKSVAQQDWEAGNKKGHRLLALLTQEQDHELSKAYPGYYRDRKFLREVLPQALTLNRNEL